MDQRNTGKGGGSGYVRTHSRAALMAGFETHIFCVSKNDDTVETDFGTVHAAQVCPDSTGSKEAADAPLIITVSRHDPRKGLATLIRSLASLRNKGVVFRARLASGGPLLHYHRQPHCSKPCSPGRHSSHRMSMAFRRM